MTTAAARTSVRPTAAELNADAILAQIPDAELDALARALARVLLSAAKNRGKPQRAAPKAPARLRRLKAKPTPVTTEKRAARG